MSKPALTARSLSRILAQDDPKSLVVIATRDAKGRLVHLPVHSVSTTAYDARRKEIGLPELTPQAVALGFTDEDVVGPRAKPAIVLSV